MPLNYSPYMNMALANSSDGDVKFLTWRVAIDGSQGTSNFMIIDKKFEDTDTEMAKLKNVSSLVYLAATKANDNQFNATSTNIEEYKENMVIILSLNNPVLGQTALKVNDLAAVYIKKFDMSQNLVDLQKDDLRASRNYLLRYDTSGYWVVVSQIRATDFFTAGVSNNILKVENNLITDSGQSIDKVAHNRGEYANEAALLLVTDGTDGDYAIVLDTATIYVWANDKWNSTVASYYSKVEADARYLQLSGGTMTGALNGTDSSFTGNLSVDGTSTLTGKVTTGDGMDVTSDLSVGGAADITTNATVGGTLEVTGAATLKNSLTGTAATFTGVTTNGNLSVTGTSALAGITGTTLTLSGEAALNGGISTTNLRTSGTASVGTDLTVLGNSILKSTTVSDLTASGNTTLAMTTVNNNLTAKQLISTYGLEVTGVQASFRDGILSSADSVFRSSVRIDNNADDTITFISGNTQLFSASGNKVVLGPNVEMNGGITTCTNVFNATNTATFTEGLSTNGISTSGNINMNNKFMLNYGGSGLVLSNTTTFPILVAQVPAGGRITGVRVNVTTACQAGATLGLGTTAPGAAAPTTPNWVAYGDISLSLVGYGQVIYFVPLTNTDVYLVSSTGITSGRVEFTAIY